MTLPPCGNYLAGTCERNEVRVAKETDAGFIIYCECCKSSAFWPHDKAESRGRYEAFLSQQAQKQSEEKIRGMAPLYSIPSLNPGVKAR